MKSNYILIAVYTVLISALIISVYNIITPSKGTLYEQYIYLYKSLEDNIDLIESNMDEITVSNDKWDWWKLKGSKIEDEQLEKTYDLLVSDIRTCYLLSTDLKNKTYDNIKILSFKNKRKISDKQLIQLSENDNCLKNFDKYDAMVLSDDQGISKRIKGQLSVITDYEDTADINFASLLNEESVTISKVAKLTNWLKIEYKSRKNF